MNDEAPARRDRIADRLQADIDDEMQFIFYPASGRTAVFYRKSGEREGFSFDLSPSQTVAVVQTLQAFIDLSRGGGQ